VRGEIRRRHYSPRTEEAYVAWVRRYVHFHGLRHPSTLGPEAITSYLTHLATDGRVSASTQNQALAALLFLYVNVLGRPPETLGDCEASHQGLGSRARRGFGSSRQRSEGSRHAAPTSPVE
jgi:hypothetical protein